MRAYLLVLTMVIGMPVAAHAADGAGRYTLAPSGAGYVRLDTQTGQISQCTGAVPDLICKSVPDERAAMEAEIDRLTKDNDSLRANAIAGPGAASASAPQPSIPSDKDVDKAFNFMERIVKRFKGLIEEMRKDPPAPSQPL